MQRRTELWIVGGFIVLVLAIAIIAGAFGGAAPAAPSFNASAVAPISSSDHVRGDVASSVSLIEYGDFQCPACGAYEPIVEQLTRQYGNRVAFVFRNFPLTQLHQDAQIAAQAAEAAGMQGKYWQMHDLLYQNQATWSAEPAATVAAKYFDGYARSLGLDVAKFDADINSDAVKSKVKSDVASGNAAQIDHTPTFFIDLKQIPNPQSAQEFTTAIDAALNASATSVASSTTSTQASSTPTAR